MQSDRKKKYNASSRAIMYFFGDYYETIIIFMITLSDPWKCRNKKFLHSIEVEKKCYVRSFNNGETKIFEKLTKKLKFKFQKLSETAITSSTIQRRVNLIIVEQLLFKLSKLQWSMVLMNMRSFWDAFFINKFTKLKIEVQKN